MGFVVFHNWNLPPILPKKVNMYQNERFVIIIQKTKTMVIFRLILGIFGDSQNFQISRFQKMLKFSGNWCIWQIARYWVFFPFSFGHWVWFFTQNFWIFIFLEFPDSTFQKIWNLEIPGNWKFKTSEWKIKLSDQNWVGKIPNILQFVKCSNFQRISRFSGIWKSGNSGKHQKCPKLTYKWPRFLFFELLLENAHFGTFSLFWAKLVVDFTCEKQQIPFEHCFSPRMIFFHKSKLDGLQKLEE